MLLVAGLLGLTVGCGDDGGGGAPTRDGEVPDNIDLMDECVNPSDMAATARDDYGEENDKTYMNVGERCGQFVCMTAADREACLVECMREDTDDAVSVSCTTCFAYELLCGVNNCLSDCLFRSQEDCEACRCEKGCTDLFFECAGEEAIEPYPCPGGGGPTDGGTGVDDAGTGVDDAGSSDGG